MADSNESKVARVTKPVSEALLNEKVRLHDDEHGMVAVAP